MPCEFVFRFRLAKFSCGEMTRLGAKYPVAVCARGGLWVHFK